MGWLLEYSENILWCHQKFFRKKINALRIHTPSLYALELHLSRKKYIYSLAWPYYL